MALLDVHREIDRLFARHQEALLDRDIGRAMDLLARYTTEIREHIRLEEEHLLPIYRRAGPIPGGDPRLFTGEHRKILAFLEEFRQALEKLRDRPESAGIIALFDRQATFKNLMEHHDLREANLLYPTLDRVATTEELKQWCSFRHDGREQNPELMNVQFHEDPVASLKGGDWPDPA